MAKTIGTSKTLRNGTTIEFTKANPTTTFKAINRELTKRGFQIDDLKSAKTGSSYLESHRDNLYIDVRASNHTNCISSKLIEVIVDRRSPDNDIDSITIDLSAGEMNIAGFRSMLAEVEAINAEHKLAGIVESYRQIGVEAVKKFRGEISDLILFALEIYLKNFANL